MKSKGRVGLGNSYLIPSIVVSSNSYKVVYLDLT